MPLRELVKQSELFGWPLPERVNRPMLFGRWISPFSISLLLLELKPYFYVLRGNQKKIHDKQSETVSVSNTSQRPTPRRHATQVQVFNRIVYRIWFKIVKPLFVSDPF